MPTSLFCSKPRFPPCSGRVNAQLSMYLACANQRAGVIFFISAEGIVQVKIMAGNLGNLLVPYVQLTILRAVFFFTKKKKPAKFAKCNLQLPQVC